MSSLYTGLYTQVIENGFSVMFPLTAQLVFIIMYMRYKDAYTHKEVLF